MAKRKVLLVEPNYKNKYPPMGLMKLATYFRRRGDDVRFYKGDMKAFAVQLVCEDLIRNLSFRFPDVCWAEYYPTLKEYVRLGKSKTLAGNDLLQDETVFDILKVYREKYRNQDYFAHPRFDRVCVTTLFTFYWQITIDTINFAKRLCKPAETNLSPEPSLRPVMVGGIMSSLIPEEVEKATGITPHRGLLDRPHLVDADSEDVIDELPLDYSILEEIDYAYPANNAYFAYMTRGCVNKCRFCAVPRLEPNYRDHVGLRKQIEETKRRFGPQKDLLLLDNNVLASKRYNEIIDEIKACGFAKGETVTAENPYLVAFQNLKDNYNNRAYIRKIVKLYDELATKLPESEEKKEFEERRKNARLLHDYTATRDAILALDDFVKPLFERTHHPRPRARIVDFNQGIDSRLVNDENMKKLAEVNIQPLRIAFDHWNLRNVYEKAVKTAVRNGITKLSNYLLYNFEDTPDELYNRLRMNVDLSEKLDVSIYSFPMKYHPLNDPAFFMNRDFIGKHWNRKFIRAIQAILNSTKGKVGRGVKFFEAAFGKDLNEFHRLLWTPETFLIYRRRYNATFREELADRYDVNIAKACDESEIWWAKFSALSPNQLDKAKKIIAENKFSDRDIQSDDAQIVDVLKYYQISREDK